MISNQPVSLGQGRAVRTTPKAICVHLDDFDKDVWIPQSQVHANSEVWKDDQRGEVIVQKWWADRNGYADPDDPGDHPDDPADWEMGGPGMGDW